MAFFRCLDLAVWLEGMTGRGGMAFFRCLDLAVWLEGMTGRGGMTFLDALTSPFGSKA